MTDKDLIIEILVTIQRDGTISLHRKHSEPVAAHKAVEIGMLDVAKSIILSEFKRGTA
jgi:hypothetical protein